MAWQTRTTVLLSDTLRFAVRAALIIDGIAIAISSIYVVAKLCWFTVHYLDRTWFAQPW
ncbi:MAG: hypothetical protein HY287_15050 [Planctomycetes bacterium]|nr:hypothetical protein [Planctomycetota bacterium]